MNLKKKWLAKNCPNADRNYYEIEDDRRYIYCKKFKAKCKPTTDCIKEYYKPTFKTKQDLQEYYCLGEGLHTGSHKMISEIFNSFKERAIFYKSWKGKLPIGLPEPALTEYRKWTKSKFKSKIQVFNFVKHFPIDDDWLFDYTFGDVK